MKETAQFERALNTPLSLGQANVSNVKCSNLGTQFSVNAAAGTVTVTAAPQEPYLFFEFDYPDPPPRDTTPPDWNDSSDLSNYAALRTAVQNLRDYLNTASPTAAQSATALKVLIRVVLGILKRLI